MPISDEDTSDIGFGNPSGKAGTLEWAKWWRLQLGSKLDHIDSDPKAVAALIDIGDCFRAWTLLKDKQGRPFTSFEHFCESPKPYGLGTPMAKVVTYLSLVKGKQAVQLETVAPAKSPPGKKADEKTAPSADNSPRHDGLLRAILRAPAEVQDLYRAGLISQKLAARLGPKNPSKAPSRETVVEALRDVPRERKAIDNRVRDLLGEKKDRVAAIVKAIRKLPPKDRARIKREVAEL